MAISNRQENLFAAEDWRVAYRAFSEVNFQAYDYDTIRAALVEYIRTNFPENFNDYIESSEFIAIIELLAYLSQSIAFRMDVNTRENFLETAERRDSVFKLAKQLGYSPKRNIAASGLIKVVAVRTTEPLTDSEGNDIGNNTVFWNDANNPDSYEQFITIMNSAFGSANRFTKPSKSAVISNIETDLYQINTPEAAPLAYGFSLNVNGITRNFEAVNADINQTNALTERHPDPKNNFHIMYRNDGLGADSENTGFFLFFKQGSLTSQSLNFTQPVENRTQAITANNINETDVYLQQVNSENTVITKWQKVPNTGGQTLVYNNLAKQTSALYAVETLGTGGINLRFGDGNFADVPEGTYRVYYRTSDAERFTLQPDDAQNIVINIPYVNQNNSVYTLRLTVSLQNAVSNSLPAETLAAIKQRAPQQFYTQDRMVNNQDYQVLPLAKYSNIKKLKATNKTHAGHSRYIDINDPTTTFQTVSNLARDGMIYKQDYNTTSSVTISSTTSAQQVVDNQIAELLKDTYLNDFVYGDYRSSWLNFDANAFNLSNFGMTWKTQPRVTSSSTGYFVENVTTGSETVFLNNNVAAGFTIVQPGCVIKFVNPSDATDYVWRKVVSIANNGALNTNSVTGLGPVQLSEAVVHNWIPREIITSLRTQFTAAESTAIQAQLNNQPSLGNSFSFGLGFDPQANSWYVIDNNTISNNSNFSAVSPVGESWLLRFTYVPVGPDTYRFNIEIRGQQYIFESYQDLRFYNISENPVIDEDTGQARRDIIEISDVNTKTAVSDLFTSAAHNQWYSQQLEKTYTVSGSDQNIPLATRSTTANDVTLLLSTNFGLYPNGDPTGNIFVNEATIVLPTTTSTTNTAAVVIENNTGAIGDFPANLTVQFGPTTFGANIVGADGNIAYRAYDVTTATTFDFEGSTAPIAVSNANITGKITVIDANVITQSGNIIVTDFATRRHRVLDNANVVNNESLTVKYSNIVDQLDAPISWQVVAPVTYDDGYEDPRKVVVTPVNTSGDNVPDDPLQFSKFVDNLDRVYFETFTDINGYVYTRPVKDTFLDLKNLAGFTVNFTGEAVISTVNTENTYSLSGINWILVNTVSQVLQFENDLAKFANKKVFCEENQSVYVLSQNSTDVSQIRAAISQDYFARTGRGFTQNTLSSQQNTLFRWDHYAPIDVRIDPSISNVVELFVLTENYYNDVTAYLSVPGSSFPAPPTGSQLATQFADLETHKAASDQLVYRSAKFRRLFGSDADQALQARFKVVKLPGTGFSNNEIKTRVLAAINQYFDINNWDFGETFYFTELSSYIHQQVGNAIGSIVIVPRSATSVFGDLFQVRANSDELFLSTATVDDIEIVDRLTNTVLRTGA